MAHWIGRALLASIAVVATSSSTALAASSGATLGTAYYSPLWKAIVVPYAGPAPRYAMGAKGNRVYLDFDARYLVGTRSGRVNDSRIAAWSMAPRSAHLTRVTITLKHPTSVRVLNHPREHLLAIVPAGAAPKPAPKPASKPASKPVTMPTTQGGPALGAARYDRDQRAVAIHYSGSLPSFRSGTATNPPRVFFDFYAAGPKDPQHLAISGHGNLVAFSMAARGAGVMRATMTFKSPVTVEVQPDLVRRELLLVPQGKGAPTPAPTPRPLPTPTPTPTIEAPPGMEEDPTLAPPRAVPPGAPEMP